jgi:hypothetical protein
LTQRHCSSFSETTTPVAPYALAGYYVSMRAHQLGSFQRRSVK